MNNIHLIYSCNKTIIYHIYIPNNKIEIIFKKWLTEQEFIKINNSSIVSFSCKCWITQTKNDVNFGYIKINLFYGKDFNIMTESLPIYTKEDLYYLSKYYQDKYKSVVNVEIVDHVYDALLIAYGIENDIELDELIEDNIIVNKKFIWNLYDELLITKL